MVAYGSQPCGNAIASVIAGAGWPGSFRYSFTAPVTVSVTWITYPRSVVDAPYTHTWPLTAQPSSTLIRNLPVLPVEEGEQTRIVRPRVDHAPRAALAVRLPPLHGRRVTRVLKAPPLRARLARPRRRTRLDQEHARRRRFTFAVTHPQRSPRRNRAQTNCSDSLRRSDSDPSPNSHRRDAGGTGAHVRELHRLAGRSPAKLPAALHAAHCDHGHRWRVVVLNRYRRRAVTAHARRQTAETKNHRLAEILVAVARRPQTRTSGSSRRC